MVTVAVFSCGSRGFEPLLGTPSTVLAHDDLRTLVNYNGLDFEYQNATNDFDRLAAMQLIRFICIAQLSVIHYSKSCVFQTWRSEVDFEPMPPPPPRS